MVFVMNLKLKDVLIVLLVTMIVLQQMRVIVNMLVYIMIAMVYV